MRSTIVVLIATVFLSAASLSYKPTRDGRYQLTRAITVQTKLFGPITLTRGYRSDGSSSPIADTEGSRIAGFVHDALYSASGHLRFAKGYPNGWTREQADATYCELLARGTPVWHATANCRGAKSFWVKHSWQRLRTKRERRWTRRATRPAL